MAQSSDYETNPSSSVGAQGSLRRLQLLTSCNLTIVCCSCAFEQSYSKNNSNCVAHHAAYDGFLNNIIQRLV